MGIKSLIIQGTILHPMQFTPRRGLRTTFEGRTVPPLPSNPSSSSWLLLRIQVFLGLGFALISQ